MGQLFRIFKNRTSKYSLIASGGIFLLLVLIILVVFRFTLGGIHQPIAFNHKIHADNDLECSDCHIYYKEHASSGRPSIEICAGCHEEPQGESKEEKRLIEYIQAGKEVDWQRLYRVPEDVYFSHRRHVVLGSLECMNCHGNIGESIKTPARPMKIDMEKCMKCHKEKGISNDCFACHR